MKIQEIIQLLEKGEVGVIPTDTIYGLVGSVLNPQTVEKIYKLRKRAKDKPMIILISSLDDLKKFNIQLTDKMVNFLKKMWPNPLSVVLPIHGEQFKYLHRGTESLAFRMPKDDNLLELLKKTGPLVAPSANYEGEKHSQTINESKQYFGNKVFYVDGGKLESQPSTLIQLNEDGSWDVLRQGKFKV